MVFLEDGASDIEVSQFEKKLSIDPNVKNFVYTSKNDAATKFSSEIGENFVEYLIKILDLKLDFILLIGADTGP